ARDDRRLVRRGTRAQRRRRQVRALAEHRTKIYFAGTATLQPDDEEVTAVGERVDVPVQICRAQDVQDKVDATVMRGRLRLRDEVLCRVVDRDIGAERSEHIVLRQTSGGEYAYAESRRVLDGERADAAPTTVDKQRLPVGHVCHSGEVRPHRARDFG